MKCALRTSLAALAAIVFCAMIEAGAEPSRTEPDSGSRKNQWIPISTKVKPVKRWCSTWYMPATDEFFHWGRSVGNYYGYVRRYDVETLSLADEDPRWKESLPKGKEEAWAGLKFPDWARNRKDRMNWKPIKGPREGGVDPGFMMSFVTTEGVLRPNRCPIFHQAVWDSKRNRLFFFAGGKTFTYCPVERTWADLKTPTPVGLHCLAWHTLCYDPVGDKVVLFGGGAAMNLWGGAKTLVYTFEKNVWERPKLKDDIEPELRCNARMVYDSKNKVIVMFGGNAMDRTLNDTWIFDPAGNAWEERKPETCPPVSEYYGACYVEKAGQVFLCRARRGSKRARTMRGGDAWSYDVAKNVWTPLKGRLPDEDMEWLSCDYAPKHHDAIVCAIPNLGTYLYKPDPATWEDKNPKRRTGKPGQEGWFYNGQRKSILNAPPGDRENHAEWLKALPANTVVHPKYPETIYHRDWGSAAIDTDRGVVLYTGGGHSTYKGNEIVQYDIGLNRWAMDSPPCMMPFEWRHGAAIYGWRYRLRPSDQHTYRWYAYDTISKLMVYLARPCGPHNGQTVLLDEDPAKAFVYDSKKHGYWAWLYDPVAKKWAKPLFGRPFKNNDDMSLVSTPKGIICRGPGCEGLYRLEVARGSGDKPPSITYDKLDSSKPHGRSEMQPFVYDSKRERVLTLSGRYLNNVYEHGLKEGAWKKLAVKGRAEATREAVYDPEHDCVLALGEAKLFVMDCKTHAWKRVKVDFPKIRGKAYRQNCAMVYDPVHKLTVMLLRSKLHLFRYDPKTAVYVDVEGPAPVK